MRRLLELTGILAVFVVLLTSCSGESGSPLLPQVQGGGQEQPPAVTGGDRELELTDATEHPLQGQPLQGSHALWGLYEVTIDPENDTVEFVPLRASNIHLNALKFLEPNGQYGMVQLASPLQWNSDKTQVDLDIRLVHPFPGSMQFSGFDVKGIVITKGTRKGFFDSDITMADNDETRLLNADGYTRWWNPREFPGNTIFAYRDGALGMKDSKWHFECTLNGFKYFADALQANTPVENMDPDERGIFRAGSQNVRHYKLSLLGGLVFNYAIDASWEPPTVKPPIVPDDFPPQANQPEPYRIVAVETANGLYYESNAVKGGQLKLDIRVYDWQKPLPPPQGSVKRVVVEWPGLFAPTEATFDSDQGMYGLWKVTLNPVLSGLTASGPVEYLVWAESNDGGGYGGILPGEPLIAANRFVTIVANKKPNFPPEITSGVDGNSSPGLVTQIYSVTASDPDGDPLSYLWSVEPLGSPYNFDDPGNGDGTVTVNWGALGFGQYTVQARVSDGVNAPVEATPLNVSVGNTPPHVGDIEGLIDVAADDTAAVYSAPATDPDQGQTLSFTWSFVPHGNPENFNIPGDPVDGSMTVDYSNVQPGQYDINVRVSDGFAFATATPILVTHNNTPPSVGAVAGKTPVTSVDTNELYQAPWSDPDKTQTLSFRWSVVPKGAPENFTIVSNPDGSVNINWANFAVGEWDVNIRANDGIANSVGTKLTVEKKNTPPVVGEVSGPEKVSSADTAASYSAPISDIDPDQNVGAMWSVVPSGSAPSYIIPSLPDKSVVIDWSAYPDGYYDVNVRANDGYALVEGSLLIVQKLDNKPPTVGAVAGPTSVYHTDHAVNYTCAVSDPDGDPLTVFWSIVPHGNPPSYTISGAAGVPLTVDWADYPNLGDYDINMRADDLHNPPVEGTPLVVTILNTPPSVGTVVGKGTVNAHDTSANYSAPISDPDPTQTLTILWSVVVSGSAPNYVIPAKPDKSVDINWAMYNLGFYDVNVQVSDGITATEGTKFTVHRVNTPPVVGTVSGPNPVYCGDKMAKYQAPVTEYDPGQTVTRMWSVVPSGTPPAYIIPAQPDGSLLFDWEYTFIGDYDVNVLVDDGYTQVEATKLSVSRQNTPPTVGAVTGPSPVTNEDIVQYSIQPPAADCDPYQTLQYSFSIQPKNNPPVYNIPSTDGSITVDWSTYGVGEFRIQARVSDGVVAVFATPKDVVVTLAPCSGSAHMFFGAINPSPYSVTPMSVLPRADIAFLDSGNPGLKGLGVVQVGPSTLGVFDADSPGPSGVLFRYFLGKKTSAMSIDSDPVSGRILTVTLDRPDSLKIIDSSIIIGPCIIGTIETGSPLVTWVAVDFEQDGDFWAVQRDSTFGVVYQLVHYTYLAGPPYYVLDPLGTMTITPKVGTNTDIFDIAINYSQSRLYVFEGGPVDRGVIHSYNIAGPTPVFVQTVSNIFSKQLDYDSGGATGFAGYADIDIDHVNSDRERCRLVVYGRLVDMTSEVVRMDNLFNVLDREGGLEAYPAFAINSDPSPSLRNLIMPAESYVAYWATPSDW